jgi:class 3 adenylate cyclase
MAVDLDPAQADDLYRDLGDARAFGVIHELFRLLDAAIREAGGAVVKTVGEGLLAAFPDPAPAVFLALELEDRLARSEPTRGLRLRQAIHRGTALAASVNDHLDYFGAVARQVSGMTGRIAPGELALAPAVAADPSVAALLAARGIEPEVVSSGLADLPYLIRIGPSGPPSSRGSRTGEMSPPPTLVESGG